MLNLTNVTYRIAGRVLLANAGVSIPAGHKVGIVGANGAGKSTLLKLITGALQVDEGEIRLSERTRIGVVAQEAPSGSASLIDTVLAADTERAGLLAQAETCTDPNRIGEIHTRLADIDAHSAEARASSILTGLGFSVQAQRCPCADFSGGWRMRVALAATLFCQPDLLLLDEPSNHLDLEATLWLESYLATYPGTVLLVSHDRDLLNVAVKHILHVDQNKLTLYGGNYDAFEKTRRLKMELATKAFEKQTARAAELQAFVDRFRAKASKARQAQSRLKMLEKMDVAVPVAEARPITFDFPNPAPLPPPLITLNQVAVGYHADQPVLRNLNLRLDQEDRVALLGANGNGKSTLAKLLCARLNPQSGEMIRSAKLGFGYFAQHQTDELDPEGTPLSHMSAALPDAPETKIRAQLGRFAFGADKADTRIRHLSGGEKARLLFALMSRHAPHVMILDEPTNHLDIDSRDALMNALNAYEGAVILISHDPRLVEACADRLWLVAEGTAAPFEGDMNDYRKYLLDQARLQRKSTPPNTAAATEAKEDRKAARKAAADKRAELAPIRKRVRETERRLEKLGAQKQMLETEMADPAFYQQPSEKMTAHQIKIGDLNDTLEALERQWLEDQEALEGG